MTEGVLDGFKDLSLAAASSLEYTVSTWFLTIDIPTQTAD